MNDYEFTHVQGCGRHSAVGNYNDEKGEFSHLDHGQITATLNHKTNPNHWVHSFHKHLLCTLCGLHLFILLVRPQTFSEHLSRPTGQRPTNPCLWTHTGFVLLWALDGEKWGESQSLHGTWKYAQGGFGKLVSATLSLQVTVSFHQDKIPSH